MTNAILSVPFIARPLSLTSVVVVGSVVGFAKKASFRILRYVHGLWRTVHSVWTVPSKNLAFWNLLLGL